MDAALQQKITEKYFLDKPQGDSKHPDDRFKVRVGDTVVVYSKIIVTMKVQHRLTAAQKQALKKALAEGKTMEQIEESKLKSQPFRGVVIRISGTGKAKKITVRRIASGGIGVEKIFPIYSPVVERIEIIKPGRPRRAKLYYLRKRVGRKAVKVKTRDDNAKKGQVQEENKANQESNQGQEG